MRRSRGDKWKLNGLKEIVRRQDCESEMIRILLDSHEKIYKTRLLALYAVANNDEKC